VARNVLGTHIRGARRVRALQARLATVTVECTTDEQLTGVDVTVALAELPPNDREALMLVNWEGLTPAEAAHVLGESPAAFRVRLHRARGLSNRWSPRRMGGVQTGSLPGVGHGAFQRAPHDG